MDDGWQMDIYAIYLSYQKYWLETAGKLWQSSGV